MAQAEVECMTPAGQRDLITALCIKSEYVLASGVYGPEEYRPPESDRIERTPIHSRQTSSLSNPVALSAGFQYSIYQAARWMP
jgi:hypothetical protein